MPYYNDLKIKEKEFNNKFGDTSKKLVDTIEFFCYKIAVFTTFDEKTKLWEISKIIKVNGGGISWNVIDHTKNQHETKHYDYLGLFSNNPKMHTKCDTCPFIDRILNDKTCMNKHKYNMCYLEYNDKT